MREARHPLTPTDREPRCDVLAQIDALANPYNPKRAMWISRGTPGNAGEALQGYTIKGLKLPAGTFYGTREDCARLLADPTEETLAELLGYVESKSEALAASLPSAPLIVQARDHKDGVVLEMLASTGRLYAAYERAAQYGVIHTMTMEAALKRRQRLIAAEGSTRSAQETGRTADRAPASARSAQ